MRRRNVLVDTEQAAAFPDMEYTLLRCPKFYAKENLETVFPDAAKLRETLTADTQQDVSYYLLYTFQPSDYVMEKPREGGNDAPLPSWNGDVQDLSSDEASTPAAAASPVAKEDEDFSELIQSSPVAAEWKDRSRDRFFHFMKLAKRRIHERLSRSADVAIDSVFMDWPDPATGLPMSSERGASTFNDADTIQQFFSYNSVLIAGPGGGCRMIEHPRFGLNVYPAAGVVVVPQCAEAALCDAVRSLKE